MLVSTKGRYALRMMIDLAEHQKDGLVALKDIAERQEISKKYLEQIIPLLNKAGFLRTVRGIQGGYRLAHPAESYTIYDILTATEGTLAPVACLEGECRGCERASFCDTLPIWEELEERIRSYLSGITLQDILDKRRGNLGNDYVI